MALTAFEEKIIPSFDGSGAELGALLMEGLASGEDIEADEAFWSQLRIDCHQIADSQESGRRRG